MLVPHSTCLRASPFGVVSGALSAALTGVSAETLV